MPFKAWRFRVVRTPGIPVVMMLEASDATLLYIPGRPSLMCGAEYLVKLRLKPSSRFPRSSATARSLDSRRRVENLAVFPRAARGPLLLSNDGPRRPADHVHSGK